MKKYKTQCYFNLHRRCFSLRSQGIVQAHANFVELQNVSFNIAKAGQKLVRDTKRKNVHATVSGNLFVSSNTIPVNIEHHVLNGWEYSRAVYNPYRDDTFVDLLTGAPVTSAYRAVLIARPNDSPRIYYRSHSSYQ